MVFYLYLYLFLRVCQAPSNVFVNATKQSSLNTAALGIHYNNNNNNNKSYYLFGVVAWLENSYFYFLSNI